MKNSYFIGDFENNIMSSMRFLSANVRHLRQQEGLSRNALGKAVGVSSGNIAGIEDDGRLSGSAVTLVALSQFFGVSVDDLLGVDLGELPSVKRRLMSALSLHYRQNANDFLDGGHDTVRKSRIKAGFYRPNYIRKSND